MKQFQADLKEKDDLLRALDNEILEIMIEHAEEDSSDREAEEASDAWEKITYNLISLKNALKKWELKEVLPSISTQQDNPEISALISLDGSVNDSSNA